MAEKLEDRCKMLIVQHEYKKCEKKLGEAMLQNPHSAIPHNLMGILMEKERNHVLAMKHFRAAYALDPTYIPARYNMEQYGTMYPSGKCAYTEEDCPVQNDPQFQIVYDEHHVGHLVRK
ncbi:hypothetical protein ACQRBH_05500 [Bariatricus sp. SGI.161]|uniref:hypothetical protein n=1 Tax=Lachnospiraceae TaxID=186803 RepID=UPI00258FE98E|nr:hypothetical protein [Blautia sp.]MCI7290192.1 hypothetical protein [Blautia sp.]MDY5025559.1 hypothetical protein [Oliverpabstia sp.]